MTCNVEVVLSEILKKIQTKPRNFCTNLGMLFSESNSKNQYVILSRCFSRDRIQMNRGYNDFDKELYILLLLKSFKTLPEFNTVEIANIIYNKFQKLHEIDIISISNELLQCDINSEDIDDQEESDDNDTSNNETMLLMAQMGLPTQFSSLKSRYSNTNQKKKKYQDFDKIFENIKERVTMLISNPNDVVRLWISRQEKQSYKIMKLSFQKFNICLLESSIINDETKDKITEFIDRKCYHNLYEQDDNDEDLIRSLVMAIEDYVTTKCTDWLHDLDLSDSYISSVNRENSDFVTNIMNSIGLSYDITALNLENVNYKMYPVIPVKSVLYSLKHDLSLGAGDFEYTEDSFKEDDPLNKYYFQRYRYFDKFDEGILLDEESWYSVTPAVIAQHTAKRFKKLLCGTQQPIIIDAFCGAGGNAIRFAEQGFIVLAIDFDQRKLKFLLHNASIYGVEKNIVPICHDYFNLPSWITSDQCPKEISFLFSLVAGINISPPWGGPEYLERYSFDITVMNFSSIMTVAHQLSNNISCFIPRQSNCSQIMAWFTNESHICFESCQKIEIEQNCVQNKVKALTLYTNMLVQSPDIIFL